MIVWTFAHVLSVFIYCQLTGYVLYKNVRSPLNWTCAGILASFGLWSLGAVPRHGDYFSRGTVELMTNISAPGWFGFSAFGLLFILIFTERRDVLEKKWFMPAIFIPPLVFVVLQWGSGAFIDSYVKRPYGWDARWSPSPWVTVFSVYYTVLMFALLWMLYRIVRTSTNPMRVNQARIIALTCLLPFVVSSLTNVVLPRTFNIYRFAALGDLFTLTFAFGIVYAVARHQFMITPAMAAEKILSTMGESLLLVKPDGVIATVNEATLRLLGYDREELENQPLDLVIDRAGREEDFTAKMSGGGITGANINLLGKSGQPVPVLFSSAPLTGDYGEPAGVVCIARNMTEHRKAEEDRQNLVKMQERDEVCRWLHDHLGADLYNISLICDISRSRKEPDPSLANQLDWISETSRDALNSIRSYLDFADNAGLSLSDLALRMEEYGRLLLQSKGIEFTCNWDFGDRDRPLSPIKGFSVFLVFKESVTNILKHAGAAKVAVSLNAGKDGLELFIRDDGIGYVPGRTATADGHGITNIATWADKAGGRLSVEPAPESGTVVRLSVPA